MSAVRVRGAGDLDGQEEAGMTIMAFQVGDTWGIPGPVFIAGYVVGALVALAITLAWRRSLSAGRAPSRELDVHEVAYLAGGEEQALVAALTGLRAENAIEIVDRRLRRTDARPRGRGDLDHAVAAKIGADRVDYAHRLLYGPAVRRQLHAIRDRLVRERLLLGAAELRQWRAAALPLWLLLVVGVARLVAGASGGKPVGFLILALLVLTVLTLILTFASRSPRTRAATAAVAELRKRHRHLDPAQSPAWRTYGPDETAYAAALYGTAVLKGIEPKYGVEFRVEHPQSYVRRRGDTATGYAAGVGGGYWAAGGGSCGSAGSSYGGGSCGGGGGGGGGGGCGG
jgi:uncharacterized protein (TIGR04222 family)